MIENYLNKILEGNVLEVIKENVYFQGGTMREYHKYSCLFPLLEGEEFQLLKKDIQEQGLLEPICLDKEGRIIDGRNRYRACVELNIEPDYTTYTGNYVLEMIISKNLIRRHLTASQRAVIALDILPMYEEEARKREYAGKKIDPCPKLDEGSVGRSDEKVASIMQVARGYIADAKRIAQSSPELLEDIRTGEKTIPEVKEEIKKIEQEKLRKELAEKGRNITLSEQIDLRLGDFREVLRDISQVDLILTDPPYSAEYLPLWQDLGKFAKDKLKNGGYLVAYSGQYHLPEVMNNLREHLDYVWVFCLYHEGKTQIVNNVNVICRWKPILVFQKGKSRLKNTIQDCVISEKREKDYHSWQQGLSAVEKLIEDFTDIGDVVCDPFSGGGTVVLACKNTGRLFVGAEVNEESYHISKERVNNDQVKIR